MCCFTDCPLLFVYGLQVGVHACDFVVVIMSSSGADAPVGRPKTTKGSCGQISSFLHRAIGVLGKQTYAGLDPHTHLLRQRLWEELTVRPDVLEELISREVLPATWHKWLAHNSRAQLTPLQTTGSGDCLLNALSLGMYGVQDRTQVPSLSNLAYIFRIYTIPGCW